MIPRFFNSKATLILALILLFSSNTLLAQDIVGGAKTTSKPGGSNPNPQPPAKSVPPKTTRTNSSRARGGNSSGNNSSTSSGKTDPATIELAFWDSIKDSTDPEDFRAYLKKYPNGQFIDLARNRLNKLVTSAKPNETPATVTKTKTIDPLWSTTLYEEHFDNNNRQWFTFSNESGNGEIRDGKYILKSTREYGGDFSFITKPVAINQNEDFKVELVLSKIEGNVNWAYGLVWGLSDSKNFYSFFIENDGKFAIQKITDGKINNIVGWAEPNIPINSSNQTNKLTIKKEGSQIQYFINNNFVGRAQFQPFFGNYLGFMVYSKQTIAIDDFVVSTKK